MVLFHSALNVIILVLLLLFAFQYQVIRNREVADARYTLAYYLFAGGDRSRAFHRRIETIDEFVSILEHTVRAYYAVPTRSRGLFMHYTDLNATQSCDRDAIAPPELFVQYHEGNSESPAFARIRTETYPLTLDDPIGPFANASALLRNYSESCAPQVDRVAGGIFIPCRVSAIGNLLDRVVQLRLSFSLFSRGRRWSGSRGMVTIPSTWDIVVEYGFEGHKAVMTMVARLSSVSWRQRDRGPLLVCWLIVFAALLDLYWRLCIELKDAAAKTGKHPLHREITLSLSAGSSTPAVKEKGWKWLGYLSNAIVLAFATAALDAQHRGLTGDSLEEAVTLLLAFATLLSSFRVVVLLKLFPAWYVLIDGLATALEQLFVLAVGVLPVLVGYAVCGTAVFGGFGSGSYFQSVPPAIVTMLCSMFGDNLLDTFVRMDQSPHQLQIVFARLFFVTFLALFVCNILNIAHSIIQDSYSKALKSYASTLTARETTGVVPTCASPSSQYGGGGVGDAGVSSEEGMEGEEKTSSDKPFRNHKRSGGEERVCECFTGSSVSSSLSSCDWEQCSTCGLPKPRRQRERVHGPLRAAELERMLHRLNKLSL
jgi:hypothetical protein